MNPSFVLDAGAAVAWASPDEHPPRNLADAIENRGAVAPALWIFEVCNVLHVLRRRNRLTNNDWDAVSKALSILPIELEPPDRLRMHGDVLELAEENDLSVYDASYLELALRRRLPLATLDETLRQAAKNANLSMLE